MPAPRTGSIARNAISQTPFASASTTLPAASKVTNSMGTSSRFATSRASSAETPRGSPLAGSFCASTVLPKLIAARSLPLGASSLTTLRGTLSAMAAPHTREKRRESRKEGEASALNMQRSSGRPRLSERACIARALRHTHTIARATGREAMAKITRTNPEGISKPFSNYSHVVTAEGAQKLVFCAGQVGADVDGKVLPPDDFEAQAKMRMANLTKARAAGGAKIADVPKTTIYICNPHDVPKARGILQTYFAGAAPASTLCILRGLANPNFLLEIEAIAAM